MATYALLPGRWGGLPLGGLNVGLVGMALPLPRTSTAVLPDMPPTGRLRGEHLAVRIQHLHS